MLSRLKREVRSAGPGVASACGVVLVCLSTLAGSHHAAGQSGPQGADSGTGTVPSASKNQVSLYIAMHDKKDRPLSDLKPGDLAITDAGRVVPSDDLRVSLDAQTGDHLITFLFDRLDPAGDRNAERAARNILKNLGDNALSVSVWAIGDRLRIIQSYTKDRNLVERAVHNATGGPEVLANAADAEEKRLLAAENAADADARGSRQRSLDKSLIEAINDSQQVRAEQHAPWSISCLSGAAHAQRALEGRKAIVYFTQTVPSDLKAADMFRAAAQRMRDASISLFVVDLNAVDAGAVDGMQATMAMGQQASFDRSAVLGAPASRPGTTAATPTQANMGLGDTAFRSMTDTISGIEFDGLKGNENLLGQLTLATGGAYTNADVSSKKICRQILAEVENYYTISYPAPEHPDHRFHAVSVKMLRAGVKIDEHPGYFAVPAEEASARGEGELRMSGASGGDEAFNLGSLSEGASSSDLAFRAAMLRFGTVASGIHGVLALEVPIKQLEFREDPNTRLSALHVTVAAELKNAAGTPVARFHEEFQRRGSTDSVEKLRAQYLSMERSVNLPAGEYRLDAIVRDWNADKTGASTQTIHLSDADDSAILSDLVLVRSTEDKGADAESAVLRYGHAQVDPNLSGELSDGGRAASIYFQLYPEAKKTGPEELRLEVSKDGKLLATLPMHMQAAHANEVSSRVADVKLGGGPGTYDLTLCLDRGGQTTKRHLTFVSAVKEGGSVSASAADAAPEGEAKFEPPSIDLDLKSVSGKALEPAESSAMLSTARERALSYSHTLPNFLCVEKIDRSVDPKGTGVWKRRDSIVEMLRYVDRNETRTVLEVNGQKSHISAEEIKGAKSNGEFGGILQIIFDPAAGADFAWQKTEQKDGETLQVFSYKVDAKKSQFFLTDHSGSEVAAPFHGLVLIDNDTHAVRRLLAQTDELPHNFDIKASWMTIDYDYIAINGHDYLLPTSGEVGLKEGRSEAVSNQLRFSNYRRFGSHARILSNGPITNTPPQ